MDMLTVDMGSNQHYYLQNGMLSDDGWFYSTVCDLQESTTFGAKAQKTAISQLVTHGLIKCENKGLPAKRHFKVIDNTENLMRLIEEGTEISENISEKSKAKNSVHGQNSRLVRKIGPVNIGVIYSDLISSAFFCSVCRSVCS